MSTCKTYLIISLFAIVIAACGFKGPLYMPTKSAVSQPLTPNKYAPSAPVSNHKNPTESSTALRESESVTLLAPQAH